MTEVPFQKPPVEWKIRRLEAKLYALRFRGYHRAAEGYGGWNTEEVSAGD